MDSWLNAIRQTAASLDNTAAQPRYGIVGAVDPDNHCCKVFIEPEHQLTGWIGYDAMALGNGVTMTATPSVGDQVKLVPQEGDSDNWHVVARCPSLDALPGKSPATGKSAQEGEIFIQTPKGGWLHFTADGKVYGGGIQLTWKGDVLIDGNLVVTKDISDQNGAHGKLADLRNDYNAHDHPNVQNGDGSTGTTNKPTS